MLPVGLPRGLGCWRMFKRWWRNGRCWGSCGKSSGQWAEGSRQEVVASCECELRVLSRFKHGGLYAELGDRRSGGFDCGGDGVCGVVCVAGGGGLGIGLECHPTGSVGVGGAKRGGGGDCGGTGDPA